MHFILDWGIPINLSFATIASWVGKIDPNYYILPWEATSPSFVVVLFLPIFLGACKTPVFFQWKKGVQRWGRREIVGLQFDDYLDVLGS